MEAPAKKIIRCLTQTKERRVVFYEEMNDDDI